MRPSNRDTTTKHAHPAGKGMGKEQLRYFKRFGDAPMYGKESSAKLQNRKSRYYGKKEAKQTQ